MTGPEHYREGERLLAESANPSLPYMQARGLAAQAHAHFAAARVAVDAEDKHPLSVAWQKAVGW